MEGAALLWRHENKPLRGNDENTVVENMCQDCTSHHSSHLTPHVDTHLGRNILSSFVRILVQFLTFLNNSAPVRIARSYSVLNMPKRATDKGQEARLQLALLLHTIGKQIHFVTMHAALRPINFVPGPFLSSPPSPPLRSFCFANAVDVWACSLSLLSFIITPGAPGIRCVCVVCVCGRGDRVTWDQVKAARYSSWPLRRH